MYRIKVGRSIEYANLYNNDNTNNNNNNIDIYCLCVVFVN